MIPEKSCPIHFISTWYVPFSYSRSHLGPHGLPLIGRADWNDCLNLNCFSEEPGESFPGAEPDLHPACGRIRLYRRYVRKYGKEFAERFPALQEKKSRPQRRKPQ